MALIGNAFSALREGRKSVIVKGVECAPPFGFNFVNDWDF
jgi:hypothetical protein